MIAKLLIENGGVDPNVKNKDGEMSLHVARFGGNWKTIEYLIEKGADINAKYYRMCTVLHHVSTDQKLPIEVFKLLIEKGADVNAKNKGGRTPLVCCLRCFHEDHFDLEITKRLIDMGADVNTEDNKKEGHHYMKHAGIIGISYAARMMRMKTCWKYDLKNSSKAIGILSSYLSRRVPISIQKILMDRLR